VEKIATYLLCISIIRFQVYMKYFIVFFLFSFSFLYCFSQEDEDAFQTVKGKVIDKDSKTPLWGATVMIVDSGKVYGAITDTSGYFKIENVPVGRQTVKVTYIGYEDLELPNVLVNSEQDISLNVQMNELTEKIQTVTVIATIDKDKAP